MRHFLSGLAIFAATALCQGAVTSVGAGDEAYEDKTLELRSGSVTLKPTQAPPEPNSPSLDPGRSGSARDPAPSKSDVPPADQQPGDTRGFAPRESGGPAAPGSGEPGPPGPRAINRPIASERVILSFERRLTEAERQQLASKGIEVGEFLGKTAYNARVSHANSEDIVRASQGINTVQHVVAFDERIAHIKIDPSLSGRLSSSERGPRGVAARATSPNVTVQLWQDADPDEVKRQLEAFGTVNRVSPKTRKIELTLHQIGNVEDIAKLKGVQYVAPSYGIKSQNTRVTRNIGVEAAALPPHELTGSGVRIGLWDGGHVAANHPSFTGRLSSGEQREHVRRHDDKHATHVAGTLAGSGEYVPLAVASDGGPRRAAESTFPAFGDELTTGPTPAPSRNPALAATAETADAADIRYPGVAPGAPIFSFDFNGAAEELVDLLSESPDAIDVVNNSWGVSIDPLANPSSCTQLGTYAALDAAHFDSVVSGGEIGQQRVRRIPIVFAAGNVRNDGVCGLSTAQGFPNYRTVIPPGTAKNVITVGAIDADTNEMTEFSGWGPTANGRVKPDVVAPGCRKLADGEQGIMSMVPANSIGRSCGTSMAAPAVTGVVALMIEKMTKLGLAKAEVFPSTYKALLIHGAEDLGRPGPDFEYGYGRVRMAPTLTLMHGRAFQQSRMEREGEVQTRDVTVPAGAGEVKVTLVWDDRPTAVFTDEALANDLDLVLVSPARGQHLPSTLNAVPGKEAEPALTGIDRLNVVEQVLVRQPGEGAWRIEVRAGKIGSPVDGQTYSLVTSVQ